MSDAHRPILDLDYFNALANDRGLVPMTFLQNAMPHLAGDTAGFIPSQSLEMYRQGQAVPFRREGESLPEPRPARTAAESPSAEAARLDAIEVTPAVFAEHDLAQIQLAQKISGQDGNLTLEKAQKIIRAELARRQKAGPTPGAVTTASVPRAGRAAAQETA